MLNRLRPYVVHGATNGTPWVATWRAVGGADGSVRGAWTVEIHGTNHYPQGVPDWDGTNSPHHWQALLEPAIAQLLA